VVCSALISLSHRLTYADTVGKKRRKIKKGKKREERRKKGMQGWMDVTYSP
jgi:hypothetical protein